MAHCGQFSNMSVLQICEGEGGLSVTDITRYRSWGGCRGGRRVSYEEAAHLQRFPRVSFAQHFPWIGIVGNILYLVVVHNCMLSDLYEHG